MKKILLITFICSLTSLCSAGIDFDGVDDYLCKDNPSTATMPSAAPFSVSAWIYPDSIHASENNRVFTYGERSGADSGFSFGLLGEGTDELRLTTLGVQDYNTTAMTVVTGEWQFIAVSLDASFDATFYHYRLSTDTLTTDTFDWNVDMNTPDATSDIFIGIITGNDVGATCSSSKEAEFDGKIDDVKVYDTDLSQAQIELDFRSRMRRLLIADSNRKGYWLLDDVSDGVSADGTNILDFEGLNTLVGVDGANNTGLLGSASEVQSYP